MILPTPGGLGVASSIVDKKISGESLVITLPRTADLVYVFRSGALRCSRVSTQAININVVPAIVLAVLP